MSRPAKSTKRPKGRASAGDDGPEVHYRTSRGAGPAHKSRPARGASARRTPRDSDAPDMYFGSVEGGVVRLRSSSGLRDGDQVCVLPLDVRSREAWQRALRQVQVLMDRPWLRLAGAAEGLPADLSVNLDHYLYGAPRRHR